LSLIYKESKALYTYIGKRGGRMDKFDEIYSHYLKDVYRFLLNLSGSPDIAEEVTQQTFAIAFEKLDSFRGECKLSVWLCQIAKHEFLHGKGKAADISYWKMNRRRCLTAELWMI